MFASLAALVVLAVGCPPAYTLDVTKVCQEPSASDGSDLVTFPSPKEVMDVIKQFEKDKLGGSCPAEFEDAFAGLKLVLDDEKVLDDICGREAYNRIRSFHLEFIHYYVPDMTSEQLYEAWLKPPHLKPIPRALRSFFINFATQVNVACKKQLVQRVKSVDTYKNLEKDKDYALIKQYNQPNLLFSFLKKMNEHDKNLERVRPVHKNYSPYMDLKEMLSSDLIQTESCDLCEFEKLEIVDLPEPRASEDRLDDGSILYAEVRFNHHLKLIKEACRRRFRPVYMELFAPIIRLNNLGYAERLMTEREDDVMSKVEVGRWIDIIQTCEAVKDIVIVQDHTERQDLVEFAEEPKKIGPVDMSTLGSDVKLLSRQEVNELEKSIETSRDRVIRPLGGPVLAEIEHKPLKFTQRMWITSRVLSTDPKKLLARAERLPENLYWEFFKKVNKLFQAENEIADDLKIALVKMKRHFEPSPKQMAMLGHLATFVKRHRTMMKGVSTCISLIFMSKYFVVDE